jgi:YidC/Oxa1 family membrane protein insertase
LDRNTLLAIALSLVVLSAWSSYEASQQPTSLEPSVDYAVEGSTAAPVERREEPNRAESPSPPSADRIGSGTSNPGSGLAQQSEDRGAIQEWSQVYSSDLYRFEIQNRGGGITSWKLLDPRYTLESGGDDTPLELVTGGGEGTAVLSTPLEGLGIGNLNDALFEVEHASAEKVVFHLERDGIGVRKIFDFDPENYLFELRVEVENSSDRVLNSGIDVVWPAEMVEGNDFKEQALIALVDGEIEKEPVPGVGSGGFFSFLGNADEGPSSFLGRVEWVGVSNRFFISALLPSELKRPISRVTFLPVVPGKRADAVLAYEGVEIRPGDIASFDFEAYIGPKVAAELTKVRPGFERSIDLGYSWLEPLTRFFHWLLGFFYSVIPNYGVAIVLVTVLVRIVTLPIMNKQTKSMERMRELQPQLKEIQEKYKEDRQRQSEEQMKLYKEEGVNPLGGCLPMLLQFPVFIGLFYSLQSEIALRHAPFALWITDLSAPEVLFTIPGMGLPVRLLPIVMGVSMVLQQKMTPATGMDPAQQKMMSTVMPVMMTVLFYQFPSGLVLYWMISNFLAIGHQLWVRRTMEKAAGAK